MAAGLMQKDLAFEAGLSTSAVSRAELGRGSSLETIRSIADVLDCEVTDLLPLRAGGRS